jgi:hypothetical protein
MSEQDYQLKADSLETDPVRCLRAGLGHSLNLVTNPAHTWPTISELPWSYGYTLTHYILIMMAVPTLAQFFGKSFALKDMTVPLFEMVVRAGALTGSCVVASLVAERLSRKLGSPIDHIQALKLIGFSYSAYYLASPLFFIPFEFAIALTRMLSLFACIFLLHEGTNYYCSFEGVNRWTFLAAMSTLMIGGDLLIAVIM